MKKKDDIKKGDYVTVKEEFCEKGNPINRFMFEVKDMYTSEGILYLRLESFLTTADRRMFEKVKDGSDFLYSKEKAMHVCCSMNDSGKPEYSIIFNTPESNIKKDVGVTGITKGSMEKTRPTTKVNQYAKFKEEYTELDNIISRTEFEVLFTKDELDITVLKGVSGGIPSYMLEFSEFPSIYGEVFDAESQILIMEGEVGRIKNMVFRIKDREKKIKPGVAVAFVNKEEGKLVYNKEDITGNKGCTIKPESERPNDDYKNDFIDGKTRWDLIPWEEIEDLARLYTKGAEKYKPGSWKELKNGFERYGAAAMRHFMKYRNGERYDPETGAHHLTAVVWNTLAMLWFDKNGKGYLIPDTNNKK